MRELLKFADSRQRSRFVVLTLLRSVAGILDLAALGLLWFLASSLVSGSFTSVNVLGINLLEEARVTEVSLSLLAVFVAFLFVAKGLASLLLLKRLSRLTVELEVQTGRSVLRASFQERRLADPKGRKDVVGTVHAAESGALWARGVVFGYSVAISESVLVLALVVIMIVASPLMSLVLLSVLGAAAAILNIYLAGKIRASSKEQLQRSKELKSNLNAAVSAKVQIGLRGLLDQWETGVADSVRKLSTGATNVYFLRSMPRYVMEIAVLLGFLAVGAISLLAGDLADNVPGAAVILAGAFRIAGALLPLQAALNSVQNVNQLGRDFFDFVESAADNQSISPLLAEKLEKGVREFLSSDEKILLVAGKSGLGKSTALASLLLESELLGSLNAIGFAGQRPALLPGGLERNIWLTFESGKQPDALGTLDQLIDRLEMRHVLARLNELDAVDVETFSGGELTRLELLRAHVGNPQLIFLDEPTSGLDDKLSAALAAYLNESPSRYVVITHDKGFADRLKNSRALNLG